MKYGRRPSLRALKAAQISQSIKRQRLENTRAQLKKLLETKKSCSKQKLPKY